MRDIQNGLFGWYEKGAMEQIEKLPRRQQASCKLVYIAICSSSAKRKNSPEIECYKFEIAKFASVDEKTVQRCLPLLENLQIIQVSPQDRLSNGRYSKMKIWLKQANFPDGQFGESSEKVRGKFDAELPHILKKEEKKETKKIKKKIEKEIFEIPEKFKIHSRFMKAWEDFEEHREGMKSPLTPVACRNIFAMFEKVHPEHAIDMIQKSIVNGWRGIFPLKDTEKRYIPAAKRESWDAKREENQVKKTEEEIKKEGERRKLIVEQTRQLAQKLSM